MTPAPLTDSSAEITSRWRLPEFPACCLSPGSAKEVRHSLKGLCGSKKLEENEMFQKFKMKMLPASNEGREAGLREGKATSQRCKMKLQEN